MFGLFKKNNRKSILGKRGFSEGDILPPLGAIIEVVTDKGLTYGIWTGDSVLNLEGQEVKFLQELGWRFKPTKDKI